MKIKPVLFLLLTFICGTVKFSAAQSREQQKIQIHKQKKFSKSNLTVRFVSLVEDSRCPSGANCVWAGNAKIKIEISKEKAKETFEVNTNLGPKGANFEGYAIELTSLTPKENIRINKNGYVATFVVSRLTR